MKRIIQIHTGGWHNKLYETQQIIQRISKVLEKMPIDGVIIGWHLDDELYIQVGKFLKEKHIDMYLWLPVFSEINELGHTDPLIDLWGHQTEKFVLQEGESFEFCCPTSSKNHQLLFDIYHRYFKQCHFDGVFLDKIRTQSFISQASDVLGCCCPQCQTILKQYNAPLNELSTLIKEKGINETLQPQTFDITTGFHFKHDITEQFFEAKKQLYTKNIVKIVERFKEMNLKVGLDVYAPALARLVGQDIAELLKHVDFIKPMMYRRTQAPAGISFEYHMLKKALPDCLFDDILTSENQLDNMSVELFKKQLDIIGKERLYPGIEVNYREDIARTDVAYVKESLQAASESGCGGIVYAWDIMLAPDEHFV